MDISGTCDYIKIKVAIIVLVSDDSDLLALLYTTTIYSSYLTEMMSFKIEGSKI